MDAGERWKTIALAVFAFAFLAFASRAYLSVDSFKEAAAYDAYSAGTGPANAFYQITGALSPVVPLGFIAPVFGTLAIIFIYLALRQQFGSTPALIASALLASAPAFTRFASAGVYSPEAMAFAFFSLGAYLIFVSIEKKTPAPAAVGALLLAAAPLINANAALAAVLLAVPLGAQALGAKKDGYLAMPAGAALAGAVLGIIAAGIGQMQQNIGLLAAEPNLRISMFSLLALLPLAACAIVPYVLEKKRGAKGMHEFAFCIAVLSLIAAAYAPYLALFGLALACAYSVKWVFEERENRKAEMFFLGLVVALTAFPLLYGRGFSELQVGAFSLLLGAFTAFILIFYEGKHTFKAAAYGMIFFLLSTSFLTGAVLAQAQFSAVRPDIASALEAAREFVPASSTLYGFGLGDQVSYVAQKHSGDKDAAIARFLLTDANASALKADGVDYLLVDAYYFDDLSALRNASGQQAVRMDAFLFEVCAQDQAGIVYAIFVGKDAQLIAQTNKQCDQLTGTSYSIRRSNGESLDVPASRALLLKYNDSTGIQPNDRMVYPGDSYYTNLFKLYFGEVDGMQKVYPAGEGAVRIYKIS